MCYLNLSGCAFSRKPCSEYKMKEITGSGIFVANGEDDETEDGSANPSANKTGIRMYQVLCFWIQNNSFFYLLFNPILILCFWKLKQATAGISHISFGEEESVSPKKPASLPEVAKQRELSGTMESEDNKLNKQLWCKVQGAQRSGHICSTTWNQTSANNCSHTRVEREHRHRR